MNGKCPRAPHIGRIESRVVHTSPNIFSARMVQYTCGVPRKRSTRSSVAAVAVRGWFCKWQRENRGDGTAGGMVVTRTGHCHPRGYRQYNSPPPSCKITLCRARWEITFCPSITGWIFGRRDPIISNEIRLRFEIPSGKGAAQTPWLDSCYPAPDRQQPFDQVIINPLKVNARSSILCFFFQFSKKSNIIFPNLFFY